MAKVIKTDVLVIGKGAAGLRAAQEAVRVGVKVTVISKGGGASPEIMGMNAPTAINDSVNMFFEDTMKSGGYLSNSKVAYQLASQSAKEVFFLNTLGVPFDRNDDGSFTVTQTLGSSVARMNCYRSLTGITAMKLMIADCKARGVQFDEPVRALNLLVENGQVAGASAINLDSGEQVFYLAKATILATGGNGDMHPLTSYPAGINGDGYAMAYRAGAQLVDMELQQYDPCGFIYPDSLRGRVVVTTMLLEEAKLLNGKGEEFILKDCPSYHMQKCELSRRMGLEIAAGRGTARGGLLYDCTAMSHQRLVIDNCLFYDPPKAAGLDLTKEPAEVAPVAHSMMGGLVVSDNCASVDLPGLFGCGETIGGVHGANRIGGSAGAEVFVYGAIAGASAGHYVAGKPEAAAPKAIAQEEAALAACQSKKGGKDPLALLKQTREVVDKGIGIIRSAEGMKKCQDELKALEKELDQAQVSDLKQMEACITIGNSLTLAKFQAAASLLREESRGVFYRSDFPNEDPKWTKNIYVRKGPDGEAKLTVKDTV